jgi:metal-dependent amidase/aminoacylase/carboxypeptidase family protein
MTGSYRALKVNLPLAEAFAANGRSLGIDFEEVEPDKRLGSTDMGDVSQKIPAIHPYLNIAENGSELVGHTHEFREAACSEEGMRAMVLGAKAMAGTAVDILFDPRLRESIQKAFVRR